MTVTTTSAHMTSAPARRPQRTRGRLQRGPRLLAKRAIDVSLAVCALVLAAPIMAVIAVAIALDSRGPVIFRQERLGRHRQPFTMFKFRSMRQECDSTAHREFLRAARAGTTGGKYKADQAAQITGVGRFIRRTSLDELPQLWNVIKGDMSLVGPRPDVPYALDGYSSEHWRRFEVLPGITGLWQVSGRSLLSPTAMLDLDVDYVDDWSLAGDLSILARTIPQILQLERAA